MKINIHHLLISAVIVLASASLFAEDLRDQSFDSDWRFLRADASGAENLSFDDSRWRKLNLPHDWSIEDLPPRNSMPELEAVTGQWLFRKGDDAAWKVRELDDRGWERVMLPDTWQHHSNYTNDNVYGWFRRRIEIPEACRGKDFMLLLGCIDDADETWLNGERIGGMGSFPPNYQTAWDKQRRYRVPASLVHGDGSDLLAARVFNGEHDGGILEAGLRSGRIGPFDSAESENADRTGYVLGGISWYRKHFTVDQTNKQVAVRFDGVYMNADFWINGHPLGNHPYGYTSFEFDLTPYLKPPGKENILAVRVKNEGKNSRWYSGSGIYRHTWLTTTEPVHIPIWDVFVTTPQVSKDKALVKITTEVTNASSSDADLIVRATLIDAADKAIGHDEGKLRLMGGETRPIDQHIEMSSPKLWSPDSPNLYSAKIEIFADKKIADVVFTHFGIRKIEVDAENGFRLNGEPLKLKGGCVHHDNGPLGSAAVDRAEERRVELMKANGFNAIRTSHNPPSPAFLDACDRLGMLVIDEAFDQWNEAKIDDGRDYHLYFKDWCERDIASMVRRDRNHPSVVMWSIGNEIPEQFRAEATAKILRAAVLSHDATRLITQAVCSDWGNVSRNWDKLSDSAFLNLDIAGYNYLPGKYESDHARHPERVMMGTESYPRDFFDYWSLVEKHPYVIGDFVWTAMDYFGEAGIGHSVLSNQKDSFFMAWPWFDAWCGDLDVCGFKKPQSLYRDVVWRRSKIEMAVHSPIPTGVSERVSGWGWPDESQSWNWPGQEGKPLQVSIYSRGETVRLELNGGIVGEKPITEKTKLTAKFDVSYAPGELRAFALKNGKVIGETTLKTSGPPKKLRLTADRASIQADRNDLSYLTVEVVDVNGQRVPNAEISVSFFVNGVGELAGQASGAPNKPASFKESVCQTFQGRCLVILRPTNGAGEITLRAEALGIDPGGLTVRVRPKPSD